jgi:DNA-binding PadR family transcriptional regulator
MNGTSLDVLRILFEFKIVTAWQLTRFLKQRDRVNYIYLKLHRMWQAGYLESFKVYTGSLAGVPVYYALSKRGLKALAEAAHFDLLRLKNYPSVKNILSSGSFKHEAQVVELASLEALNRSTSLNIAFKGETDSLNREYRSDKNIEVLAPDYTVLYIVGGQIERVFTEFERTNKTHNAMIRKIERYINFLSPDDCKNTTLRIIFQTPGMETAFWLNLFLSKPHFVRQLRIMTTHLALLGSKESFMDPVYVAEDTMTLERQGRVIVKVLSRIKLFSFL